MNIGRPVHYLFNQLCSFTARRIVPRGGGENTYRRVERVFIDEIQQAAIGLFTSACFIARGKPVSDRFAFFFFFLITVASGGLLRYSRRKADNLQRRRGEKKTAAKDPRWTASHGRKPRHSGSVTNGIVIVKKLEGQ